MRDASFCRRLARGKRGNFPFINRHKALPPLDCSSHNDIRTITLVIPQHLISSSLKSPSDYHKNSKSTDLISSTMTIAQKRNDEEEEPRNKPPKWEDNQTHLAKGYSFNKWRIDSSWWLHTTLDISIVMWHLLRSDLVGIMLL